MSKVIYWIQVSLDGFIARPDGDLDWANVDDELLTFANQQARAPGTFLYGRRMYEVMAGYWPTAHLHPSTAAVELDFTRIWNDTPRIVLSKTLDRVAGTPASCARLSRTRSRLSKPSRATTWGWEAPPSPQR